MRPHVETVSTRDLIWHDADLGPAHGEAFEQRLSTDEETGAQTRKVRFESEWHRPGGFHLADTEWFVLLGTVAVGDLSLTGGDYFRVPAGHAFPPTSVTAGSGVLVFGEHGPPEFVASDRDWLGFVRRSRSDVSGLPGELTFRKSDALPWESPDWEDTTQADEPSIEAQILYREKSLPSLSSPEPVTAVVRIPAGWSEKAFCHRSTFEEAFAISGEVSYHFGHVGAGSYYFRPPRVQSGDRHVDSSEPAVWLIRLGDAVKPWRTERPFVRADGEAVNYDGSDPAEALIPAGLTVTSRSPSTWAETNHPRRQEADMAPEASARFTNSIIEVSEAKSGEV